MYHSTSRSSTIAGLEQWNGTVEWNDLSKILLKMYQNFNTKPKTLKPSPNSAQYGPNSAQYGPNSAQYSPNSAQYGPNSAQYSPNSAQYGPIQRPSIRLTASSIRQNSNERR